MKDFFHNPKAPITVDIKTSLVENKSCKYLLYKRRPVPTKMLITSNPRECKKREGKVGREGGGGEGGRKGERAERGEFCPQKYACRYSGGG